MEKKKVKFTLSRVVTRDIVIDAFQGIRNFFGFRLRGYEKILDKHLREILDEMDIKYEVEWFRLNVNPLTSGSAMIVLYGEGYKK